ncbi:MAG: type VI secretion system lipoprotein TssJ [Burkholderiaceae bacterium]
MRDHRRGEAADAARAARRACLTMLATGLLAACSSTPKPVPPAKVNGTIQAAANLNPSVSGRPSPLHLRIYELKSATAFNRSDFMSLYQADQTALGADLVAREEHTLQPGESRPWVKTLGADTRFIGIVGLYRDLEHAVWRTVMPVQPGREYKLTIRADSLALSTSVQP